MKKAKMIGTRRVVRYAIGSNQVDGEKRSNPCGDYYVMDLLFQRAAETDPTKGWYRKISTVWDPLESTCRHASLSIL